MIECSFVHLPGIGPETEQRLWSLGCTHWDSLEEQLPELFGRAKVLKLLSALEESRAARDAGELTYFRERLKSGEMWRIVPALLERDEKIAYLDIETTGLGFPPASHSTTIAVYFDGVLHVEHKTDLKRKLIAKIDEEAKLFVTFNGLTFDLPFLRREHGFELRHPHLDLRYWFARLGYKGGLKKLQTNFPDIHQRVSMDIDGFDAVRLWNMHDWGVANALETLMTYNAEDTIVLEQLLYLGLNMESEARKPLRLPKYELPKVPPIRTQVCPEVYRMLRS